MMMKLTASVLAIALLANTLKGSIEADENTAKGSESKLHTKKATIQIFNPEHDWRNPNPTMMDSVADDVPTKTDEDAMYDVCVIGAGPSGITAAYTAAEKGKSVAVLEKNDFVGGKTKIVTYDGLEYRMGAVLFEPTKVPNPVSELSEKFGIQGSPFPVKNAQFFAGSATFETLRQAFATFPLSQLYETFRRSLLSGSAATFPLPPFTPEFNQAVQTYAVLRTQLDPFLNGVEAYLSDYPDELNLPFSKWLADNNISELEPVFWIFVTVYGYGLTMETPALYVLSYFQSVPFLKFLQEGESTLFPYMKLLNAMASTFKEPVRLNANITKVEYNDEYNKVIYDDLSSENKEINCRSTIIAFPPVAESMATFTPTEEHKTLFSKVKHQNYYTSLVRPKSEEFGRYGTLVTYAHMPTYSSLPEVPVLHLKFQDGNNTPFVSYLASPTPLSEEEAKAKTLAGVSSFSGTTVSESQILEFNDWFYMPYFDTQDLKDGAFRDFERLQGRNNQYYTGGLFNFEGVQDCMEHGKHIVNKFL